MKSERRSVRACAEPEIPGLLFRHFPILLAVVILCLSLSAANFFLTQKARAQTGGTYDLSHNAIASGGGSNSTGGTFRLDGTAGQPVAGTISSGTPTGGNILAVRGGFWGFGEFAPTAAHASVSGRVTTYDGTGIRHARLTLTASDGSVAIANTSSFGYFTFPAVEVGRTYLLEVSGGRSIFSDPIRALFVADEITDVVFIADP